jgi:hypothetical protein
VLLLCWAYQLTFVVMQLSWVWFEVAVASADVAALGDGSSATRCGLGFGLLGVTWVGAQPLVVGDDVESACGQADDVVLNEFHVWP